VSAFIRVPTDTLKHRVQAYLLPDIWRVITPSTYMCPPFAEKVSMSANVASEGSKKRHTATLTLCQESSRSLLLVYQMVPAMFIASPWKWKAGRKIALPHSDRKMAYSITRIVAVACAPCC
jgi:hypothetical protein